MPILNIGGKQVQVDDSFMNLTPEEQEKTVEEIAGQTGVEPSSGGIAAQALRKGEIIGGGILKGLGATMGLPGTLSDLAYAHGLEPQAVHSALSFLPTSQSLVNDLGPFAGPAPETETERYLSGAAQGIGGAIPALALGPLTLPAAIGAAGAGAGSGVAAEVAHEMAPESTFWPIAAGIAGGFAGEGPAAILTTGLAKSAFRGATREANIKNAAVDTIQSNLNDAKLLHQDLIDSSKKASLDQADTMAQAKQMAQTRIDAAQQEAQQASAGVASKIGGAKTLQQAGQVIQKSASDWMNQLPGKVQAILDPVYAKVPEGTEVTPSNLRQTLEQINSSAGTLENLNLDLKPYLPKKWLSKLQGFQEGQAQGLFGPVTVNDARALRTSVGEALSNPKLLNDIGNANVERIYGALTQDIRQALPETIRPEWDAANQSTSQLYNYARNTISRVIKSPDGEGNLAPEAIASRLASEAKKGGTHLAALRSQLPEATDALASSIISTPSGDWLKLAPEAKAALVPDAVDRGNLDVAHTSAASVDASAKSDLANLKNLHDAENRQLAREVENARLRVQSNQRQLDAAQGAKSQADAALAAFGSASANASSRQIKRAIESVAGTLGGHALGGLALSALGVPAGFGSGAEAVLGGLPYAIEAARAVRKNPKILQGPAIGALAGNALSIDQSH